MIEVEGRFYPLGKLHPVDPSWSGSPSINRLYYSPWTGRTWARLDLGCREWLAYRLPAAKESPYLADYPSGSLCLGWDLWLLESFPRDLLMREISLMVDLRSPTLLCYNYPTFDKEPVSMSPSVMEKIAMLRTKVLAQTATDEELREALRLMRGDRAAASRMSDRKREAGKPIDSDAAINAIFG